MNYKDFYEDLENRAMEEQKAESSNIIVRWAWLVRIRRTIHILSNLISSFSYIPSILDLGCAGAWLHASLMIERKIHRYIGCDISLTYLKTVPKTPNSSFVLCDGNSLPFKDVCSDIVTSFETIEHLPTPTLATNELKRVTRSFLVASVPLEGISFFQQISNRYDNWAEKKEKRIRKYIDEVGWEKALRSIEERTGAAHINVFTLNRFLSLVQTKEFDVLETRGAYFYVPGMDRILNSNPLLRIYLLLERYLLSRISIFQVHIRFLPWPRVGNRYGFVILQRIGK